MRFSRTIASLLVALVGLAGYTLSDSSALEVAGLVINLGGIGGAWVFRVLRGDVTAVGMRKGPEALP